MIILGFAFFAVVTFAQSVGFRHKVPVLVMLLIYAKAVGYRPFSIWSVLSGRRQ